MLFYDIDPFGTPPEPKPLTDEEYNKRLETYNAISADCKERLRKALGSRQAHNFEKSTQDFICREAFTDLDFKSWKALLEAISKVTCGHYLSAAIRFTPKKYAREWTAERIDEKIQILGLNEQTRYFVFKDAGLPCEVPTIIKKLLAPFSA